MTVRVITADALAGLSQLPDESVHCCVTSPPYWQLRDYDVEGQYGLEPTMADHVDVMVRTTGLVADRLQRDAILIELNPDYADRHIKARIARADGPLLGILSEAPVQETIS